MKKFLMIHNIHFYNRCEYFYSGRRKYDELNEIFYSGGSYAFAFSNSEWFYSQRIEKLDQNTKQTIITRIKQIITNPKIVFDSIQLPGAMLAEKMSDETFKNIQLGSLQVLGLLGDLEFLPQLLNLIQEELDDEYNRRVGGVEWIDFLLRFLMGQHSQIRYPNTSRLEILKYNWVSMGQTPLDMRLRLGDLNDWQVVLKYAKNQIEAFFTYALDNHKEQIYIDENIMLLWDQLENWAVPLEIEPLWFFPLLQKTPLKEWIIELGDFIQLVDPIPYDLSTDLDNVEIWSDILISSDVITTSQIKNHQDDIPYYSKCDAVWPYWHYLYNYLSTAWLLRSGAIFRAMEWRLDNEMIYMITKWDLSVRGTEKIDIKGSLYSFWILKFQQTVPIHLQKTSNAILLNLQLLLQRGGNRLALLVPNNDELVMELQILRADIEFPVSLPDALPENVIEQVIRYILVSILPDYTKISYRLEDLILSEIKRISSYIPPVEISEEVKKDSRVHPYFEDVEQKLLYGLQEAVDEVIWLRETFNKHLEYL